jgi:sulfur-oxidizing protein SoxZ
MKVKASSRNGVVGVRMLLEHIMETGRRKGSDGKLIPGHYITEVTAKHKGNLVFHAELGPAVSQDPYLAFSFTGGASGDELEVSWIDNKGESETATTAIR